MKTMWCGLFALALLLSPSAVIPAQKPPVQARKPGTKKLPIKNPRPKQRKQKSKPDPGVENIDGSLLRGLKWRELGPTSMGGRIVDLAVVESNPSTFWVASASGGLFKTTNNGTTFEAQFQQAGSISIGAVCVSQSTPNIVWVGTGEHNARNSVSWGDGVYKSTDGGKRWQKMGLDETFQIGRIRIHPTNPNIVYVGALGRLWGENKERGLYKTEDGGRTWKKVLFVDDKTGCIDIAMHPRDPETLVVAMYERKRDPFDGGDPVKRWGPGSGLYKTGDGGKTWKKLADGLPTVKMGRIGVTYSQSNPQHVFAIIETERIGEAPKGAPLPAFMGITGDSSGRDARLTRVTPNGPAAKAGIKVNDVVVELGGKPVKTYQDLVVRIRAYHAGDKVDVKVKRGGKTVGLKMTFGSRGRQGRRPLSGRLGGQRENAQSLQGKEGFQTGGVFKSTDGGDTWTRINSLNPRPFYYSQIFVDPSDERFLYVLGILAYRSTDGGKTFRPDAGRTLHPDHHTMWINPRDGRHIILGCDGGLNITWDRTRTWEFLNNIPIGQFYDVGVDMRTPYRVYGGMQDNGSWGGVSRTRRSEGPTVAEWFAVGGGDGFICRVDPNDHNLVYFASQYGNLQRVNLKTGERATIRPTQPRGTTYRYNWKTPFLLSHHNSRIYYSAGNYVFKSLDRGNRQRAISPKITRTERGTATALGESPLDPDLIYVGTDDGWLWITRDGGRKWSRLTIPGRDGNRRVNSIEPSRYSPGRCYVVLDGHYYDSDGPDVWVTEDYGATWKSLNANLSKQCTRVLREDVENPNLLYLGTEFGIYASLSRGRRWTSLNLNLPHAAIHEIAVHPTAEEIVAATHGRGLWILDVNALRQYTAKTLNEPAALLRPRTAVEWHSVSGRRYYGSKRFIGENSDYGATLCYTLKKPADKISLVIKDVEGNTVAQLRTTNRAGLNRIVWNLRTRRRTNTRFNLRQLQRLPEQMRQRFLNRYGLRTQPGKYLVLLTVDGKEYKQPLTVIPDPEHEATDSLTYEEAEALRKLYKQQDD